MSPRDPVFVHAADLHLGAPLRRLGVSLSPQSRQELIAAVDTAFDRLVDETIRLEAEFLVLAGDIYDGADREAGAQIRFVQGMKRLVDRGISVYIVHGNHDPLADSVVNVVKLPAGVKVFQPGEVESVTHVLRNGGHVIVAGISFRQQHEPENLSQKFGTITRGDARAVIGVLHTNVGGASTGHSDYAPCTASDLAKAPVDYWALGHVHKTTVTEMGGNRYWAYPGNLQGRDAGETGAKGALVVPILANGVGRPQHIALDAFRFESVTVDCTAMEDLGDIAGSINAQLVSSTDDQMRIVRVRLTGRSHARTALDLAKKENKMSGLAGSLEMLCADGLRGGHIERVDDEVLPALDIADLSQRDDLLGDVLRHIETLSPDDIRMMLGDSGPDGLAPDDVEQIRELMRADILQELSPSAEVAQ